MIDLSAIQDTVINVAEAITAALEIETEIINENLLIIGGTGRYKEKIGLFEEEGNIESGAIYGKLLKSGEKYLCVNPESDLEYDAKEGELAEICCPIKIEGKVIGLIGLVAFNSNQREKIVTNSETLTLFLQRMGELIASKLSETEQRNQLNGIVESMHEGLIAIDQNGVILSCNCRCEILLGLKRNDIINKPIWDMWDLKDVRKVLDSGIAIKDKEVIYKKINGTVDRFLSTIIPLYSGNMGNTENSALGAMMLFQDISDARERMYKMTTNENSTSFSDIIGESKSIEKVKQRTLQVATSDSTVIITGESGTGKELFARALHYNSHRKENPFVTINCGAIPEMLLESELFGYEKGAFTGASTSGKPGRFEIAHKGTIFLDEIGDMPLHLQVKLLHAIQNRQIQRVGGITPIDIDVRIIAATNRNLEQMIANKEFREDLFFRLNVIPIHIPPLRERPEDLELLLEYALKKFNGLLCKSISNFQPEALKALLEYSWPGNVRELENIVEYAVNMENGDQITYGNLPERILKRNINYKNRNEGLKEKMDNYQRTLIEECLDDMGHSTEAKALVAKNLGISESTLYRRIRELGIEG